MKRIIQGVTYNTDTATKVATASWEGDDGDKFGTLYQTRGGAFFVDTETTVWTQDEDYGPLEKRVNHEVEPMTRDEAHQWVLDGEVEVLADIFPDPPEATTEEEEDWIVTTTVYLRIPSILKGRIEAAAREANQSLNVWAIRCLENCSAKTAESSEHDRLEIEQLNGIIREWLAVRVRYKKSKMTTEDYDEYAEWREKGKKARAVLLQIYHQRPSL